MDWPWQYSFPPFFTIQVSIHVLILTYTSHNPWQWRSWPLQPHSATRAKQLEAWRHLVLNYCQVPNRVCWFILTGLVKRLWSTGAHHLCPWSGRCRRPASLPQCLHFKEITCRSNTHSPWRPCTTVSVNFIPEFCSKSNLSSGNLEWTDKSKRRGHIFWKSPAQLGQEIYKWARNQP